MRRTFSVLALAGACTATHPTPAARPEPAAPTPAPALAPPNPPGEPYRRAGDRAAQVDALTFWGWSHDGKRFAFETSYAGPGAVVCEGQVELHVVDAERDEVVPGGHLVVKHRSPDADPCDPPDLQAAMDVQRPALLAGQGIVVGNLRPPTVPVPIGDGRGDVYLLSLPDRLVTAEFEVLHGGREQVLEGPGAAFRLTLLFLDQPPLVVDPGTRRRPTIWSYDFDRSLVFLAPDGGHAAALVASIGLSFEGDHTSYLAHGVRLPPPGALARQRGVSSAAPP